MLRFPQKPRALGYKALNAIPFPLFLLLPLTTVFTALWVFGIYSNSGVFID